MIQEGSGPAYFFGPARPKPSIAQMEKDLESLSKVVSKTPADYLNAAETIEGIKHSSDGRPIAEAGSKAYAKALEKACKQARLDNACLWTGRG